MLVCSGKPTGELRTTRMYQNFILEVEWRHLRPKGNAGIFVWADDITARGVPFHRSIEVQVLENAYGNSKGHTTHGDIFPIHGAKMKPINGRGGSRAFPTESRSKPAPQWNHYRITCSDGAITLAVNGKVVTKGKDCSPRKGYICLESEGGIVHYRNLRLKELPETPIDPKHVAIKNRGYRSLYTGVDLSGWNVTKGGTSHWKAKNWVLSYDGKASGADSEITTEESFSDFGFLFDIRLRDASKTARVHLHGAEKATIPIDPEDPFLAGGLNEGRGWNRFEGTLRGKRLTLTLNGRELCRDKEISVIERGPLRLVAEGPVDFANVFVRELKD